MRKRDELILRHPYRELSHPYRQPFDFKQSPRVTRYILITILFPPRCLRSITLSEGINSFYRMGFFLVWGRSQLQSPNGDSNSTNRLIFPTIFSTYTFNIPSSIYFNTFLFTNNYQITQSHKAAFELIGLPVFEQFQSFYPCQPCYLLNLKRLLKFRAKLSFQVCPKGVDCNAYDILGLYDVQNTNAIIS